MEWLKPYTDDTIRALGNKGVKAMCAVPVSFVSEHIETLEEIDQEYRELAEENGIEYWGGCVPFDYTRCSSTIWPTPSSKLYQKPMLSQRLVTLQHQQ